MNHEWQEDKVTITVAGRPDVDENGATFDTDVIDYPSWLDVETRNAIARDYARHLNAVSRNRRAA